MPAVHQALDTPSELARDLGLEAGAPVTGMHAWIVDTSIECDHQRFGGFLKLSLEELLIALRDDGHLLREIEDVAHNQPDVSALPTTLFPQGFSARQLVAVIESQAVWQGV